MNHNIINYFETLEHRPAERMMLIILGMLLLWVLEGAIPLITLAYKKTKWRHAMVNFSFTVIHLLIHTGLAVFIVLLSDAARQYHFGLVYWLQTSVLFTIIISFLMLDFFGGWLVHVVQHKYAFLWRFHVVHHSDNNVDVTTGLRHHPVESVLRGLFFFIAIAVSGAPVYAVMVYQTVLVMSTQFSHANISLPARIDKWFSYVFVSPNMHKVHHHWQQPYTDSNYGAVLSIWDRIFGTFVKLHHSKIKYGLDKYYPNEQDENFLMLMKKPFTKLDS